MSQTTMIGCKELKHMTLKAVAVLGKKFGGLARWPLIIWEATTAKQNYYRTK